MPTFRLETEGRILDAIRTRQCGELQQLRDDFDRLITQSPWRGLAQRFDGFFGAEGASFVTASDMSLPIQHPDRDALARILAAWCVSHHLDYVREDTRVCSLLGLGFIDDPDSTDRAYEPKWKYFDLYPSLRATL